MNDQKRKRMDFGAGRRQMSPEMMEAQRRLAEKQRQGGASMAAVSRVTRTQTGQIPGGGTFSRTQTQTSISYTAAGAMQRAGQPAAPRAKVRPIGGKIGGRPVTGVRRTTRNLAQTNAVSANGNEQIKNTPPNISNVANGPMTAPVVRPKKAPGEPTGPIADTEMETLEFDAIGSLSGLDATEELAQAFVEEPKALGAVSGRKKQKSPKTAPKSPQTAKNEGLIANNAQATNGKSPFINTLNIEKRPLSGHSVNKKKGAGKTPKPEPYLTPNDSVPTVVNTKRKSRKSNIALGIAIFLTVILGAVVGTFVYLAFFQ